MSDSSPGISVNGLLAIAAGRVTSLLLQMAVERELFAKLSGRSVPLAELSGLWGMPGPSARVVAQYLANAGILIYRDGKLSNTPLAEATLTRDSELRQEMARLFRYDLSLAELESQLLDPPALHWYQIREEGEITDMRPLLRQEVDNWVGMLAADRHANRVQMGQGLAKRYDFSGHRLLLDLGGASGGYCVGIRKENPQLRCVVIDLPEAAEVAKAKIAEEGESEHIDVLPGSFFTVEWPQGADVVLLANVFHLWAVEDGREILRKVRQALEPGGTLLVRESYFEDDWSGTLEPVFDAFVLVGKEGKSGWQPSYAEMEALLREEGFVDVERRRDLVLGRTPGA